MHRGNGVRAAAVVLASLVLLPGCSPDPAPPTPEVTRSTSTPGPDQPAPVRWKLHYSTDFTSLQDWTVFDNQTQDNDNSVNLARNVTAGAGGLTIQGRREAGYSRPYTSGEIVGRRAQTVPNYFRAEVTGSFEDISGVWPALLWFRPGNARDGEIDVMEWMGGKWPVDQKRVAVTMHNEYGPFQDPAQKPLLLQANPWFDPNAEHTYLLEKVPDSVTVWIDGRLASRFSASDKLWWDQIMEVADRTWYPRITLQIGQGSALAVVPEPGTDFGSTSVTVSSLKLWTMSGRSTVG